MYMKKLGLLVFAVFAIVALIISLVGCGQTEKSDKETERKYVLGEVVDGMTVVADGSDGYVLLEGINENGEIGFILEYVDYDIQATTSVSSKGKFIALLDDFQVGIFSFDKVALVSLVGCS